MFCYFLSDIYLGAAEVALDYFSVLNQAGTTALFETGSDFYILT
jgi:hypothetical protein